MTSTKLANWLQVGANIGILVGLILVGFQMKQNSELLELQLIESGTVRKNDYFNHMMGEDFAAVWEKHIVEPNNLTLRELYIIDKYYASILHSWIDAYELSEGGSRASDWKTFVRDGVGRFFNNQFGRAYLKQSLESGIVGGSNSFVNEIKDALNTGSGMGEQEFLKRVQSRVISQ